MCECLVVRQGEGGGGRGEEGVGSRTSQPHLHEAKTGFYFLYFINNIIIIIFFFFFVIVILSFF